MHLFLSQLLFFILVLKSSAATTLVFGEDYINCSINLLDFTMNSLESELTENIISSNPSHLLWTVRKVNNVDESIPLYAPYYRYKEKCSVNIIIEPSSACCTNQQFYMFSHRFQDPKAIFILVFQYSPGRKVDWGVPSEIRSKV